MQVFDVFGYQVVLNDDVDFKQLQVHVPGIKVGKLSKSKKIISFINNISFVNNKGLNSLSHGVDNKMVCSSSDIPHLVYCILRALWLNSHLYPVHSICVNESLIIGHSGTGKTTLALEALKQGLSVSSYNKTLVSIKGKMQVLASTQVVSLKNSQVLTPEKTMHKAVIKKIFLFCLQDTPLQIIKPTNSSALHQLYPFFLDTVKESVILPSGIYCPEISLDARNTLKNSLQKWLKTHNLQIVLGRSSDIVAYIR